MELRVPDVARHVKCNFCMIFVVNSYNVGTPEEYLVLMISMCG